MKLIDGKKIAEKIKNKIAAEVFTFGERRPNLAIILAGDREDSKLYVSLKEREAKKVGIDTHVYKLNDYDSEQTLLDLIGFLNNDELVDGILVQLPLPAKYDTAKVIRAIDPAKDVDGFHPEKPDYIVSPVIASTLKCLEEIKFDLKDKQVVLLYNSEVFGDSMTEALNVFMPSLIKISLKDFSTLDISDKAKKVAEITAVTKKADVIISALGLPGFVIADMLKPEAVLIDIGISKIEEKVFGDVDADGVKDVAGFLTPVPGGIGPMTIAMLFKNVLEIHKRRYGI